MKVILLAIVLVGLSVFGLCFNIIFRKKDFPSFDVGSNEEMRKRGINCFKDQDAELHKIKCGGDFSDACNTCKLYESGSNCRTS